MQTFSLKRVLFCWGVSVLVCFIADFSFAQNLVLNPSFETSGANWSAFNGAVLNSTAHPRTGTLSIRLPGGNGVGAFQTVTNPAVVAGAQFDLTAYGYITNTVFTGYIGIQATFFNVTGTTTQNIGTVETGPGMAIFSNHIDSNSTANTFILLDTGVFTAPAGTTYMQIFPVNVNVTPTGSSNSSWIDDFNLVVVPEPSSLALGIMGLLGVFVATRRRKA